ncbi:MAG TPA: hypothetical protein VKV39_17060 [Candidatus Sulfotelmatobacter sp.]|nr:hypothetical protein [Candidatus Sulfotelmatobacter sp.]
MTGHITYIVPAALLYQAATRLQPPEKLCFATGIKMFDDHVIVLAQLIDVEYTASSRLHVRPNAASVLRVHQGLLAAGQDIEMLLHSHPGTDHQATLPSPTDLHTASRWENGAPFLGAIFSEGGRFVRFFNHTQQSEVIIYGQHAATTEPNCFELPILSAYSLPADASQSGRLGDDGSPRTNSMVGPNGAPPRRSCASWLRRLRKQHGQDLRPDGHRPDQPR